MGALVSRQLKLKPVIATVATVASASADPEPVPASKPVTAELQELKETIADLREQTIVLLETKAEALRDEAKAIDEVKQALVIEPVAVAEAEAKPEPAVVETVQVSSTGCCSAAIIITADAAPEPAPAPAPAPAPESTPDLISSQPSEPNDAPQTPPSSLEETTVIKPDTSVL